MYKAIIPIGGYKIGEEVPTDKAEHWLKVFVVPSVKKVIDVTPESNQVLPEKEVVDNYTPDDLFFKELIRINGIGAKTAKDIITWGTKEKLIEAIKLESELPFRDDIVKRLRKEYGKRT